MASRAVRLLDPCDVCLHWCSVMYTYRHRNYCGHHHQSQQCCRVNEHIPIGIHVAPFPYCHRCPQQSTTGCCGRAIDEMELLLKQQSTPQETCAVVIEPVLGEGGYVPAPKPFLRDLHQLCKENDILFIADEVQSGFGRTGNFFAIDGHYGVTPDILVMAKGLASGMPLSAVATRAELSDRQYCG
eukprot:m.796744 g.796744  ORF g.796744 m.796744 type:complete len:185 (-) comp23345_c1_seq12:2728-3282(-)